MGLCTAARALRLVRSLTSRAQQAGASPTAHNHLRRCCGVRLIFSFAWLSRLTSLNRYNAKIHAHLPKLRTLLAKLSDRAQLRPEVVIIRHPFDASRREDWDPSWIDWTDLAAEGQAKKLGRTADGEIEWRRLDFNWPLWILFSSGTTGASRALS